MLHNLNGARYFLQGLSTVVKWLHILTATMNKCNIIRIKQEGTRKRNVSKCCISANCFLFNNEKKSFSTVIMDINTLTFNSFVFFFLFAISEEAYLQTYSNGVRAEVVLLLQDNKEELTHSNNLLQITHW